MASIASVTIRTRRNPEGQVYRVVRVCELSRSDLQRLVAIKRRVLKLRLRPARVSLALRSMVKIVVPGIEPQDLVGLDDDSCTQILDLAKEVA